MTCKEKRGKLGPEKPAENLKNFSKKGVAISYFACYNNTCVTATDMR